MCKYNSITGAKIDAEKKVLLRVVMNHVQKYEGKNHLLYADNFVQPQPY